MEQYRGRFSIHEFSVSPAGRIELTGNDRVKVSPTIPSLDDFETDRPQQAA
jgi:hypothetical protein